MPFSQRHAVAAALVLAAAGTASAHEPPSCASTIGELRLLTGDPSFPLHWVETSMADGKPLRVSILETDGRLYLQFRKTGEGLWAQGPAAICASGGALQAQIAHGRMQLGPAANWLLRRVLGDGATFALSHPGPAQLRIATTGWSGAFKAEDD